MFGVIGVVYNPLERIFHISAAALASAGEAMTAAGISFTAITRDCLLYTSCVRPRQVLCEPGTGAVCAQDSGPQHPGGPDRHEKDRPRLSLIHI